MIVLVSYLDLQAKGKFSVHVDEKLFLFSRNINLTCVYS